ncbi:hypothetical protein RI129_001142 [Pyrocoelia pectoralis]|uniref:Uncharacterized protein n=1 Tax=Pyrocoelia pectoralis TaxID=417401 RepID=A0AAN7VVX8_9COLE
MKSEFALLLFHTYLLINIMSYIIYYCYSEKRIRKQDAFILMAHFRSGTRNPDGTWSYSLQSCIEQFSEAFPDVNIEYDAFKKHRLRLIARYENKHCICKGKSTSRPTVLTEEVVNDIQQRIQQSPKKSIPQLSAQTGTIK